MTSLLKTRKEKAKDIMEMQSRSLWGDALHRLLSNRAAVVSLWILFLIIIFSLVTPIIVSHIEYYVDLDTPDGDTIPLLFYHWGFPSKYPDAEALDYTTTILDHATQPPSLHHLFGTDGDGRDILLRVAYGAKISLAVGFVATAVSLCIGVVYGTTAGYFGGRIDTFMMRVVDIMYGLPFMFLVILLMTLFGKQFILLFVALGAVQWLTMARIVRGQTMSIRQKEFIEAAEALGVPTSRILFKHIIPNILGPVIVYITLTVPAVILEESFLSFLGLGVQEPMTSWGVLISNGKDVMQQAPWMLIFPATFLAITLLCFNFIGDGLRDALDPKDR